MDLDVDLDEAGRHDDHLDLQPGVQVLLGVDVVVELARVDPEPGSWSAAAGPGRCGAA